VILKLACTPSALEEPDSSDEEAEAGELPQLTMARLTAINLLGKLGEAAAPHRGRLVYIMTDNEISPESVRDDLRLNQRQTVPARRWTRFDLNTGCSAMEALGALGPPPADVMVEIERAAANYEDKPARQPSGIEVLPLPVSTEYSRRSRGVAAATPFKTASPRPRP